MQALSISGDILKLPQFDFQFNSVYLGCFSRKCRRKSIEIRVCGGYFGGNINRVCNRSSYVSLGSGVFFGGSEMKCVLFGEGRSSLGKGLSIGWSLEEHPVGSEERVDSVVEETLEGGDVGEEGRERVDCVVEKILVGSLSENVGSNVGEESRERVDSVVEEILEGDLEKGKLRLSEDVGSNVDEEGKERVDIVSEDILNGNLEKGELCLSENVGSNVDEESKERVDSVSSDGVVVVNREKRELEGEKTGKVDVRGVAKKLQFAKSVEDVEQILKDEVRLPLQVFSSIIRMFGREKRFAPAMAVVAWLKEKHKESKEYESPNLFIYNSLLGALKLCREFGKLEMIMNDMREAGYSPDVVTYNTIMGIYLDDGRATEALELFEEMQEKGLPLSPPSFSTAMLVYRQMEDGNGALRLFVTMREKYTNGELQNCDNADWDTEFVKFNEFANRVCYQVMRRWLVKDGNHTTKVLKLLIEMDKAGIPPTNSEYERLIWACTREEHYTVGKELYKRIRERSSNISLSVCNHIIWLMGKSKKWWAALEVYEDLLEFGPTPNSMSYELIASHFNVLLSAAKKRGIWKWGVTLLEKMEAKGLKPRSREWNSVLVACSKASESTGAVDIFKKMVERGVKPTAVSYEALLSALEKGKLYDEAVRVWEHMRKVGIKPNLFSYTIMASVYAGLGNFNLVDVIIQEMVSTGNNPEVITFNAIITVCSRNGLGGAAYEWFERMKVMDIEPNEVTYEMLILSLAKDGKPRLAYDLYVKVRNEGLKLSYRAYDAVIQSSRDFRATIDISALGRRPTQLVKTKKPLPSNNSSSNVADPMRSKTYDEEGIRDDLAREDF